MRKYFITIILFFIIIHAYSQVSIDSYEDQTNRSFLSEDEVGYFNSLRSFSFNTNKETEKLDSVEFTILNLYSLNTYNTKYAHGMNDGSFWQGKGANSYIAGGVKGRFKNLSLILYPEFWFAQNSEFTLVTPSIYQENEYGNFISDIDNPQRYGNGPVRLAGLGQSEIRYTGEKFTIGIGSQSIWIAPGIYNSIILSNNAGGFPKIDLGIRDIDTAIGEFEFFTWWGILSESDYFDSDSTNNENLFTGIHIDYKPSFIDGLTIGLNRTLTTNWTDAGVSSFGTLLIPFMTTVFGYDQNDQRASITLDWLFPEAGFNVYTEWARNDYSPYLSETIEFPQRTQAYTIGARQLVYNNDKRRVLVTLEMTEMLVSWDYTINGNAGPSFYTHTIIEQGYTHNGQILGVGIGNGSNSQTLSLDYFYGNGKISGYLQRISISPDYLFALPLNDPNRDSDNNNAELTIGLEWQLQLFMNHLFLLGFEYSKNFNWNYIADKDVNNLHFELGYTLSF